MRSQEEFNPKVVVAIDIGTHGTGLGYAFIDENREIDEDKDNTLVWHTYREWSKRGYCKTKTDILLHRDGGLIAFGDDALFKFSI